MKQVAAEHTAYVCMDAEMWHKENDTQDSYADPKDIVDQVLCRVPNPVHNTGKRCGKINKRT